MTQDLFDLLTPPMQGESQRIYGVVTGIVTNNQDPDKLGRVRLRFPWFSDSIESWWARVATPMAGAERGLFYLPEVDDEVLVAFEQGDLRFPYVLGALWHSRAKPPLTNDDGKNNLRLIQSRSGHIIRLDDSDGAEKIEIIDKSKKNSIVIDTSANTITIKSDSDITLESSQGKVIIKGQSIELKATAQDIKVEAQANLELKASAQANLKGALVNIN